jgi:hypothetical protein
MADKDQSNEKTEQELFDEVSTALAEGKDINGILKDVSIVEEGTTPSPDETNTDGEPPAEEPENTEGGESDGTETSGDDGKGTPPASPTETAEERVKRLEQERAQLEHRLKSDAGRVAALQRKVDDLLRARAESPPESKPAAKEPSVAKTKFDEKLAKARELDPDLADLMEALREDAIEKANSLVTDKVSQTEQILRQREEQEVFHREKARLLEMVPEADEVFKNPAWRQWKESQPPAILALASSLNADEMYLAMQKFASDMQRDYPELYPAPTQGKTPPAQPDPTANKVAADRTRKLASSAPAPSGTAAKQGKSGPQTDEELFNLVSQQLFEGKPIKF